MTTQTTTSPTPNENELSDWHVDIKGNLVYVPAVLASIFR